MKQRVVSRTSSGRRPLQSRSAENLTSCNNPHETNVQVGVGRCRSAHELITGPQRDRELHYSSPSSCVVDTGHHHPHPACSRYGRRLGAGERHRSQSREPPATERALTQEDRERVVEKMHREFSGRRKAVLNGLPMGCTEEVSWLVWSCVRVYKDDLQELDVFLESYFCRTVSTIKDRSGTVLNVVACMCM